MFTVRAAPVTTLSMASHCPPGCSVVDLAAGKYSSELVAMLGDDGVHPNWAGDAAIAEGWLTALRRVARKTEM